MESVGVLGTPVDTDSNGNTPIVLRQTEMDADRTPTDSDKTPADSDRTATDSDELQQTPTAGLRRTPIEDFDGR